MTSCDVTSEIRVVPRYSTYHCTLLWPSFTVLLTQIPQFQEKSTEIRRTMALELNYITQKTVRDVLKYCELIPAIENALKDFSAGRVQQPLRNCINVKQYNGYVKHCVKLN